MPSEVLAVPALTECARGAIVKQAPCVSALSLGGRGRGLAAKGVRNGDLELRYWGLTHHDHVLIGTLTGS